MDLSWTARCIACPPCAPPPPPPTHTLRRPAQLPHTLRTGSFVPNASRPGTHTCYRLAPCCCACGSPAACLSHPSRPAYRPRLLSALPPAPSRVPTRPPVLRLLLAATSWKKKRKRRTPMRNSSPSSHARPRRTRSLPPPRSVRRSPHRRARPLFAAALPPRCCPPQRPQPSASVTPSGLPLPHNSPRASPDRSQEGGVQKQPPRHHQRRPRPQAKGDHRGARRRDACLVLRG